MDRRRSFDTPSDMARWARRIERCCCRCATYFPLLFVYGLTTWAVLVICSIGYNAQKSSWIGMLWPRPRALLASALLKTPAANLPLLYALQELGPLYSVLFSTPSSTGHTPPPSSLPQEAPPTTAATAPCPHTRRPARPPPSPSSPTARCASARNARHASPTGRTTAQPAGAAC